MYNLTKDGTVIGIRIYFKKNTFTPLADLKFAFGGTATIDWCNVNQRREYESGINGYTLFYDERENPSWDEL